MALLPSPTMLPPTAASGLRPLVPQIAALVEAATRTVVRAEQPFAVAALAVQAGVLTAPQAGRALVPALSESALASAAQRRSFPPVAAVRAPEPRLLDRAV